MVHIDSYDDLLEYAQNCLLNTDTLGNFEVSDSLDYTIRISGESWDGAIDYRVAQYVVDIQKSIDKLFKEVGIELEEADRPIVKFKIEAGSTKLKIQITKTIRTLLKNMSSAQKTYLATLLFLATVGSLSGYGFYNYKTMQAEYAHQIAMQDKADAKEKAQQEMMAGIIEDVTDLVPKYTLPNKRLAQNMGKSDTIENSINEETYTKKEFKKQYPAKKKIKAENVYIDGTYTVVAIKLDTGRIVVEQGAHRFDCLSSLHQSEADELFSKVQEAHNNSKGFDLQLRITAKYFQGSNKIKEPVIYEIGEPRKKSISIDSLLGS